MHTASSEPRRPGPSSTRLLDPSPVQVFGELELADRIGRGEPVRRCLLSIGNPRALFAPIRPGTRVPRIEEMKIELDLTADMLLEELPAADE